MTKLTVIDGKDKPKRTSRKNKGDSEQWLCRICEADTGVATSLVIPTKQSPMTLGLGKLTKGTSGGICAYCLSRGKITKVD